MVQPLEPPESFAAAARDLGIDFDPGDIASLGRYLGLLLETNKEFNLTAVEDPSEAWTRHILDSLTLLPLLQDLPDGARVIDVGSGGGLPGIPLAIVLPCLRFALLEATGKKAEFLRRVARDLNLSNVEVLQDRAEHIGQSGSHREEYDAAVARAVGRLATVAELCVPLARAGGKVLLIKGQKADEELAEAAKALQLLRVSHSGTLDTPTGRVVVLSKQSPTPGRYPRADGEPKRIPLGQPSRRST